MDVFSLLSYINKISLFAFFITTVVVGYQIYVLKKEKTKEKIPTIPDFKEKNNVNAVVNYTSLPDFLTKKELKSVNYSKLVFLIISLLTIIIIIFVVSVIKKNNSTSNQASNNVPAITVTKTPPISKPTDEPTIPPKPSPTVITPTVIVPTVVIPTVKPEPTSGPTVEPTEIVLAQAPSSTPGANPTAVVTTSAPQVLPETGSLGKGLLIIGVAISTIFFSFWF